MRTEDVHFVGLPATWAVVNTQSHRERLALSNLERQEFRAYCPLIVKRIRHARRSSDVLRPMFPGYLFVQITPDQRWHRIQSTSGVRSLIRFGNQLGLLDNDFISSLKAREIDGAVVRPASPYRIGQRIRIVGGAFDALVATIIEMDEKDRLVVLMDLLNGKIRVKVESLGVATL